MGSVARHDERSTVSLARELSVLIVVCLIAHLWMEVSHSPYAHVPSGPAHMASPALHQNAHGNDDREHHVDRHAAYCTARPSDHDPVSRQLLRHTAIATALPCPVISDPAAIAERSHAERNDSIALSTFGVVLLL